MSSLHTRIRLGCIEQFTSNLPLVISHTWNTVMANNTPVDGYLMIFEPKAPDNRLAATAREAS